MKNNCIKTILQNVRRLALAVPCLIAATSFGKSAVDFANPLIGTAEHGHVYPGATVPFGFVQLSPDTRDRSSSTLYSARHGDHTTSER